MAHILLSIVLIVNAIPVKLLTELAVKSKSLFPIIQAKDLYLEMGMLDSFPVKYPIYEDYSISSSYGYRIDPFTKKRKYHSGIDFACKLATAVHATADGVVVFSGLRGGYGRCIEIRHKFGFTTIYGHLSAYYVGKGEHVKVGKVIGFVGSTGRSTGNHLHYEVRKNNRIIKPLFNR